MLAEELMTQLYRQHNVEDRRCSQHEENILHAEPQRTSV